MRVSRSAFWCSSRIRSSRGSWSSKSLLRRNHLLRLLRISNLKNTKPQKKPQIYQRKIEIYNKKKILPQTSNRQEKWQQTEESRKRRTNLLTISTVQYLLQQSQRKENSVQSRPPLQQSAWIKSLWPGTPHSGVAHAENIWPGPPEKFPRTQHTQFKLTNTNA